MPRSSPISGGSFEISEKHPVNKRVENRTKSKYLYQGWRDKNEYEYHRRKLTWADELFALSFPDDLRRYAFELPQRRHRAPPDFNVQAIGKSHSKDETNIRFSTILHMSRAARVGTAHPRLRQIS